MNKCDTVEYIKRAMKEHPDYDSFSLKGTCHDCGKEMEAVVDVREEPFGLAEGGGFWHFNEISTPDNPNGNFMKCVECMEADPVLKNYRPCEVFSRIVGYLRPLRQWNPGKRAEFKDRVNYVIDEDGLKKDE